MSGKLYIKRLAHSEGLPLPKYQTNGSAGIDLPAAIEGSAGGSYNPEVGATIKLLRMVLQ